MTCSLLFIEPIARFVCRDEGWESEENEVGLVVLA